MFQDQCHGLRAIAYCRYIYTQFQVNGQTEKAQIPVGVCAPISFKTPSSDMNVASGFPRFASNSIFNNEDYVCDDVMYIKCTVDTAHI